MDAEQVFLAIVRLCRSIGYGRMLQIISHEWFRAALHDASCPPGAVLIANTAYGLLDEAEQRAFRDLYAVDRLIHDKER